MSSGSIPSALFFCKMFTNSPQSIYRARNVVPRMRFYTTNLSYGIPQLIHSPNASFRGNSSTRKAHKPVACGTTDSEPREEHSALETVLKLYEAIKNRNPYELSDIIAEECLCVSNFVSAFQPLLGKKVCSKSHTLETVHFWIGLLCCYLWPWIGLDFLCSKFWLSSLVWWRIWGITSNLWCNRRRMMEWWLVYPGN